MFESVGKYAKDLMADVETSQQYLYTLYGARRRIRNSISKADAEIKLFDNPEKFVKSLEPKLKTDSLQLAKNVTFTKMQEATRTSRGYSRPSYFNPLTEMVNNDRVYRTKFTGSGWSKKITVDINFRASEGSALDWGKATKLWRSEIKVSIPRKNSKNYDKAALQASRAWGKYFTGSTKEFKKSVEDRLRINSGKASFWEILDKGTVSPLPSDRGGYPTPRNEPKTNFVDKARKEINDTLASYISSLKAEYDQYFNDINTQMSDIKDTLNKLNDIIETVRFDVKELKVVKERFGENSKFIDDTKLFKAIQKARSGLQEKVNIGIRGHKLYRTLSSIRKLL